MNALFLLTRSQATIGPAVPVASAIPDEPLLEIRPGAFTRWIAEVKAETALAEAQAARGGFATNEGIAAARPGDLPTR